jgi:YggT family protein
VGFLITFIDLLFTVFIFAIIARALVSWLPIDPYHPVIRFLDQITEPILAPLRQFIPPIGGAMDITPIIALIILQILQSIVHAILIGMFR